MTYDKNFYEKMKADEVARIEERKKAPRIEGHLYCEHCYSDLDHEGIGYDSHCYQVEYPDEGGMSELEIGDTIEYYCPVCGGKIRDENAVWETIKKWHGDFE